MQVTISQQSSICALFFLEINMTSEEAFKYVNEAATPEERNRRKAETFGIRYGTGRKICAAPQTQNLPIGSDEAKRAIAAYRRLYFPELKS
jgi:DNA polymerase I-like protein with 3'-5' exonuclease and polymerase domains